MRDVRVYRIALTAGQVATIRDNGLSGRQLTRARGGPAAVVPLDTIPATSPLASRLSDVPDIVVETVVGTLPRLPHHIPAVLRSAVDDSDPSEVRVIWPAPTSSIECRGAPST